MIRICIMLIALALPVSAETVVAARTIPANALIGPDDIVLRDVAVAGGVTNPELLIGLEARVALYAGRPIRLGDVGTPAIVERNQIVPLIYQNGIVTIVTEGRSLDRAGVGDLIRVMNLTSRATVTARIAANGAAHVFY